MLTSQQTVMTAVFLMAVGMIAVLGTTALLVAARQRARETSGPDRGGALLLFGGAVWCGTALALSASAPLSFAMVIPCVALPLTVVWVLSGRSYARSTLAQLSISALVALQVYRTAGGAFIFPYLAAGALTPGFALLAGIGDVITGIAAPWVAVLTLRAHPRWRQAVALHAAFGILDLLVAMGAAAVFGFAAPGVAPEFPVTTIPLFFGPPLGIALHLLTLRALAAQRANQREQASTAAGTGR